MSSDTDDCGNACVAAWETNEAHQSHSAVHPYFHRGFVAGWHAASEARSAVPSSVSEYARAADEALAESDAESILREALAIGLDLAKAAEAEAFTLYGKYPPDGLGRRWLAAKRDVETMEAARSALAGTNASADESGALLGAVQRPRGTTE